MEGIKGGKILDPSLQKWICQWRREMKKDIRIGMGTMVKEGHWAYWRCRGEISEFLKTSEANTSVSMGPKLQEFILILNCF